jgi:molecular chaperone GrpE
MKKHEAKSEKHEGSPGEPAAAAAAADKSGMTPEELKALQDRAAKADENWERLLRTTADFDNFRKRAAREKQDAIKFANESLIEKLMPILDSFDMALAAAQNAQGDAKQSLQAGVGMIFQQLRSALADAGLEEINATGKPFDPNFHEAVAQQESKDVPEGHVMQQLRKGYKLKERLLRPAGVVVAKQPGS